MNDYQKACVVELAYVYDLIYQQKLAIPSFAFLQECQRCQLFLDALLFRLFCLFATPLRVSQRTKLDFF